MITRSVYLPIYAGDAADAVATHSVSQKRLISTFTFIEFISILPFFFFFYNSSSRFSIKLKI